MEDCEAAGNTFALVLNLDEGTLTAYKNKRRLGVMKHGLSGAYCWYVTLTKDTDVTLKRRISNVMRSR